MTVTSRFLTAFIFTLLLVLGDLWFRAEVLSLDAGKYALAVLSLLVLLWFCRELVDWSGIRVLRFLLAALMTLLFGGIYGSQYSYYAIYSGFFEPEDIGILFENLNYWTKHYRSLMGVHDLYLIGVFTTLFVLYFYGLFDRLGKWLNTALATLWRASLALWTSRTAVVILSLVVVLLSLKLVKYSDARYALTPVLSGYYNVREYTREEAKSQYEFDDEYPQREPVNVTPKPPRGNFNVLLILHESTRADHTSLFGYHRDTTPRQKQHFKNATLFPHAVAGATSTRSSLEAIFTGLNRSVGRDKLKHTPLLWHYLNASDIRTFYITSHWLKWRGMDKNFLDPEVIDVIREPFSMSASLGRSDLLTAKIFNQEIETVGLWDKPFFGVLHFSSPHYPYDIAEEYQVWKPITRKGFYPHDPQGSINQYNNAIRYSDLAADEVLSKMQRLGMDESTIIILSSDHGEAFYEHKQFTHVKVYWQEGIHVPFLIYIPDGLKKYFGADELNNLEENSKLFISNNDIFPTVLDLFNVTAPAGLVGQSLLKPYTDRMNFIIFDYENSFAAIHSHTGEKFYVDNTKKQIRVTNIRRDPLEQNPEYVKIDKSYVVDDVLQMYQQRAVPSEQSTQTFETTRD